MLCDKEPINKKYTKFLIFFFIAITYPIISHSKPFQSKGWVNLQSDHPFTHNDFIHSDLGNNFGTSVLYKKGIIISDLYFTVNKDQKLSFDNSSISLNTKNFTVGIGKINRHWSFSRQNSLILSKNARPSDSIYFIKKRSKSTNRMLSWIGPWSLEIFNSVLSNSNTTQNTLLFGTRAVLEPLNGLKFELVKTSQWGGSGFSSGLPSLRAAILGNTNEYSHANINQVAGIGISYSILNKKWPLKLYGQLVGEDEAGGLPSCNMYLAGIEWRNPKARNNNIYGIEITDTRIDITTNNNCGPNTAYNNGTYKYTNYDVVMGAPIDTESKSIKLWGAMNLYRKLNLKYSLENLTINDSSYSAHRLTTDIKSGLLGSAEITWSKKNTEIINKISYKSFDLDKNRGKNKLTYSLMTIFRF